MFKLLFGRALVKWLSTLDDDSRSADAPPDKADIPQTPADPPPPPAEPVYPRVQRRAMGSLFEIYLAGTDRAALESAAEEALDEVERLERQLSHYLDDSDISRLNINATTQWVRLEPRLYDLLKRCANLSAETGGAFDITAGPLIKGWGFFRGDFQIPTDEQLSAILENVGSDRILFDDEDHLVYFTAPGLEINLGAVGKGVAIDAAAKTLRFFGAENAVLHGGLSTIFAVGSAPYADQDAPIENRKSKVENPPGWPFDIKDPRDRETVLEQVWLHNEALSTSGNYEQFFEADGVRYSHILDPRTGQPAQGVISVSVIAATAEESDALSTAFFVMGRHATEEYCKAHPNIRVIIVEESPDGIAVTRIGCESALP